MGPGVRFKRLIPERDPEIAANPEQAGTTMRLMRICIIHRGVATRGLRGNAFRYYGSYWAFVLDH